MRVQHLARGGWRAGAPLAAQERGGPKSQPICLLDYALVMGFEFLCRAGLFVRFPLLPQRSTELGNALMIKQDGNPARRDEYGDAIAHDQSARVIDLETMAAKKLHGNMMKRVSLFQALKRLVKVLRRHGTVPLMATGISVQKLAPASQKESSRILSCP